MNKLLCLATANVLSFGCQAPKDIRICKSLVGVMLMGAFFVVAGFCLDYDMSDMTTSYTAEAYSLFDMLEDKLCSLEFC